MWERACALLLAGNGCGLDQGKPSRPLETQEQWLFSSTTAFAARVLRFVSPSAAVKCELYYLSRFLTYLLTCFFRQKLVGNDERSVSVPRRPVIVGESAGFAMLSPAPCVCEHGG